MASAFEAVVCSPFSEYDRRMVACEKALLVFSCHFWNQVSSWAFHDAEAFQVGSQRDLRALPNWLEPS